MDIFLHLQMLLACFSSLFISRLVSSQHVNFHRFVKASLHSHFNVDTCFESQQLLPYVTSFLDTCSLTSAISVRGLGECRGRCALNPDCVALAYTASTRSCVHCEAASFVSEAMKLPRREVLLAMQPFEVYVNGTKTRAYMQL